MASQEDEFWKHFLDEFTNNEGLSVEQILERRAQLDKTLADAEAKRFEFSERLRAVNEALAKIDPEAHKRAVAEQEALQSECERDEAEFDRLKAKADQIILGPKDPQ